VLERRLHFCSWSATCLWMWAWNCMLLPATAALATSALSPSFLSSLPLSGSPALHSPSCLQEEEGDERGHGEEVDERGDCGRMGS